MQRPKFQVQQKLMDFTSKIARVISETGCSKHRVREGEPCFHIPMDSGPWKAGICGQRSRKIYTGNVSDASIRRGGSLSNKAKNANRYPKKENQ